MLFEVCSLYVSLFGGSVTYVIKIKIKILKFYNYFIQNKIILSRH